MRPLDHAWRVYQRRFLAWDSGFELAQTTWEWPENRWSDAENARVAYFNSGVLANFERCPCGCQMPMSAPGYEEAHGGSRQGLWF